MDFLLVLETREINYYVLVFFNLKLLVGINTEFFTIRVQFAYGTLSSPVSNCKLLSRAETQNLKRWNLVSNSEKNLGYKARILNLKTVIFWFTFTGPITEIHFQFFVMDFLFKKILCSLTNVRVIMLLRVLASLLMLN